MSEISHSPFRKFVVHNGKSNYDVYIGRFNPQLKKAGINDFRWGNLFSKYKKEFQHMNRAERVNAFREYMLKNPEKLKEV